MMSQIPTSPANQTSFKVTAGLGRTLLIAFLILTLVPSALVTIIGVTINRQAAETDAFNRLGSVAEVKAQAIEDWLGERRNGLQAILADATTLQLLQDALHNPNDPERRDYATQRLAGGLRSFPAFVSFFVMDPAGKTVISTDSNLVGQSHADAIYLTRGLLGPFITLIKNDVSGLYDTIVVVVPIAVNNQAANGVLVGEANLAQLSRIVLTGLGGEGSDDSYLVGPDFRFLTQSHFLHKRDSGDVVQTVGVQAAVDNPSGSGHGLYDNYVDLPVVGVYRTIPALRAILMTEQLTSDAFVGINQQILSGLGVGLLAVVVSLLGAVLITRRVTRPLIALTDTATRIASGDLKPIAAVERHDEVGLLAQTFNTMTAQLRTLIGTLEQQVEGRTAQLKAAFEVGQAATSILDTDLLLREIVNLIVKRFDLYYAAVFTLDDSGRYAVLREATGEAGRTLKQVKHQLEVGGQSMVGAAISTRAPRIALDVGKEATRFANPLLPLTRSEIALPLIAGNRVLGVLDAQSKQSAAFDESAAEVLQVMANQIAVALLNAESFSRTKEQTRTLGLLNSLSHELAAAPSMEAISRATAVTLTELIGPCRLFITLRGADPNVLTSQEFSLKNQPSLGPAQAVPLASISGQVIKSGRLISLPDLAASLEQYPDAESFLRDSLHSLVALPLQVSGHVLGAFNVAQADLNAISAEQIAELEQVAAQLAVGIENRQLLQRTQDALNELDAVNRRLIGQAWEHYAQAPNTLAGEWRDAQWVTLPAAAALPDNDLRLPIRVRGETIGEFSLTTTDNQNRWAPDDIIFAQSLIDQVGQTIETARLFEETERLAQRERTINDINSRVRQTVKMDTILETAVNELARSLKAARVFARIGGHDHDSTASDHGEGDEHA
jgi:GAF domain-containing protein/HAMP domain-containing protein